MESRGNGMTRLTSRTRGKEWFWLSVVIEVRLVLCGQLCGNGLAMSNCRIELEVSGWNMIVNI